MLPAAQSAVTQASPFGLRHVMDRHGLVSLDVVLTVGTSHERDSCEQSLTRGAKLVRSARSC